MRLHQSRREGLALKKPLLLLLLISMLEKGELRENRVRFSSIEARLKELILEFGGRRARHGPKPEQPFSHLDEKLWHILPLAREGRRETLPVSVLRDPGVYAEFPEWVYDVLCTPSGRARVAEFLLASFWPPDTVANDIRSALGIGQPVVVVRRDPAFVVAVLENYRYRCAFCGFDALLNRLPYGLDAGHIRWFSQQGPDSLDNGLALCKLHHWALDRGVMTVQADSGRIQVSRSFQARDPVSIGLIEQLDGKSLAEPRDCRPAGAHLTWQGENVFLG
mgnify:CR=1 FL=1